MRDSQGGGESDPAEGVLSCIGKRTKEGRSRDSTHRIRRRGASSSEETEGIW